MERRYYGGISAYGWRDYLSTPTVGAGWGGNPKAENRNPKEIRRAKSEIRICFSPGWLASRLAGLEVATSLGLGRGGRGGNPKAENRNPKTRFPGWLAQSQRDCALQPSEPRATLGKPRPTRPQPQRGCDFGLLSVFGLRVSLEQPCRRGRIGNLQFSILNSQFAISPTEERSWQYLSFFAVKSTGLPD